jgi:hypothetical protein
MAGSGLGGDLSIRELGFRLDHLGDQVALLVRGEVAAVDVER